MPTLAVHLLALQTALDPQEYCTQLAFERAVFSRLERATHQLPPGEARLVALPELFALPLLFYLDTPDQIRKLRSSLGAALWLMARHSAQLWAYGGPQPASFYRWRAASVWPVYQQVMQAAAQRYQTYLVAGSLFGPLMDWEPSRRWHAVHPRVHNLGLVISPQGQVLAGQLG